MITDEQKCAIIAMETVSPAVADVIAERRKQRERWGDVHDDEHDDGALAAAAAFLAFPDDYKQGHEDDDAAFIPCPDFARAILMKHIGDRRAQLRIAAALLIAEIERLDRAEPKS